MTDDDSGEAKPPAVPKPPRASWEPPEVEPSVIVADQPIQPTASPTRADYEPLLPPTSSEHDLRAAVGVKPRPQPIVRNDHDDDDDDDGDGGRRKPWSRKTIVVSALSGVLGLGIAALVVLGAANKGRFVIVCEPEEVIARQGRGFPPWGTRGIDDDAKWKPIKIPPQAECRESETDDEAELSLWYLKMLHARGDALLTAPTHEVAKVNEAAAILEQALLHTRAPERADWRRRIEQLLGDVVYWRATAKVSEAATALGAIASQFDEAATRSETSRAGASMWASYLRKLVEELRSGPAGELQPAQPLAPSPPGAPPGVALPVESGGGSGSAVPAAVPIDAGPPSGGVLL